MKRLNSSVPLRVARQALTALILATCSPAPAFALGFLATPPPVQKIIVDPIFEAYQSWIVNRFWPKNILPALMDMSQTLTATGMYQVEIFGTFLDAKQQLETQELMQEMANDAHKRYQSSFDMCEIGSSTEQLAPAYRNAEATAVILSKRSIDRQLGSQDMASAYGIDSDKKSRLQQFEARYCDPTEENNAYVNLCPNGPVATADKDINYTATIEQPNTIDVDIDNGNITSDGQDLIALETNLFAHETFEQIGQGVLSVRPNQDAYLEARSIIAKRSVAENSFLNIAALKAEGQPGSPDNQGHLAMVFQQLGVQPQDSNLATNTQPSYFTMMNILASKIYQSEKFYTNLYDTPANIARKDTAMQAIGLMLGRDQFKSELRQEADLAVLLELELDGQHNKAQNQANWLTDNGRQN